MPFFDTPEELLARVYFNNSLGAWLGALLSALATPLVIGLLRRFAKKRVQALAQTTPTKVDDFLIESLQHTRRFFLFALALYFGTRPLALPNRLATFIDLFVISLTLLQVGIWGNNLITSWVRHYTRERVSQDAASATSIAAIGFMAKIVLWVVTLLVALDNLGVNITALVAGLGIGGIAVALAAQNILGDLFASLSIVIDKPFVLGDTIFVGEFVGTVEHIGLKTTRLRSISGEQLIITNSDLLRSRIRNFRRMSERRVVFTVGVVYQTPEDKLARIPQIIREYIEAQPLTRFDRAHFKGFGSFSLDFEAVYFVLSPDYLTYMDTQQAINLALLQSFAEEEIAFAYPTQTIYLPKENIA